MDNGNDVEQVNNPPPFFLKKPGKGCLRSTSAPPLPTGNDLTAWRMAAKAQQKIPNPNLEHAHDHANKDTLRAEHVAEYYSVATQSFSAKRERAHVHYQRANTFDGDHHHHHHAVSSRKILLSLGSEDAPRAPGVEAGRSSVARVNTLNSSVMLSRSFGDNESPHASLSLKHTKPSQPLSNKVADSSRIPIEPDESVLGRCCKWF
jgi:hypothetical protein